MRRVCVYCGSSPGSDPACRAPAVALVHALAERGLGVVYGGAHVGLMGVVADEALAAGAEGIGVIPQALVDREIAHTGLDDLRVVGSMHERKAQMAELADAFLALPGGLGTLEELFEVATWSQLGLHVKPCGLLSVLGYYDGLAGMLDHAVSERFLRPENRAIILVEADPSAMVGALAAWEPPARVDKWIDREET